MLSAVSVGERNSLFKRTDRVVLQLPINNSFGPFLKELLPESSVSVKGTSQRPSVCWYPALVPSSIHFNKVIEHLLCAFFCVSPPRPQRTMALDSEVGVGVGVGSQWQEQKWKQRRAVTDTMS